MAGVARDRRADRREDTGADDGADAQRCELDRAEGSLQATARFPVRDALGDSLTREELGHNRLSVIGYRYRLPKTDNRQPMTSSYKQRS